MMPIVKAMTGPGSSVSLMPCRIVAVSPLTIDFYSAATFPAVPIRGLTYALGPGVALMAPGTKPIVLPIGA